jgi:hypothetical protein
MKFILLGKHMIDAVTRDDLKEFRRLFSCADDKSLLYWHMVKCFKQCYRDKKLEFLSFIIDEVDMPLNHEAFDGFLHSFIFFCQEAEMEKDELKKDINRLVCSFLMKGFGKGSIDTIEHKTGVTPLISACELLSDPSII